ncbi:Syntaxin-binding protein 3 [Binucleata daphniae]
MNLKELAKKQILSTLLSHHHGEWHVLVIHEPTARILTNLFSFSELISHNLLTIQRLETKNRIQINSPSLYFVKSDPNVVKTIVKDHKNKLYTSYTVCFTTKPTQSIQKSLEKLANPPVVIKIVDVEFESFDNNVFVCDFFSLTTVALITKNMFNISCLTENEKEDANKLENLFDAEKRQRKGDLLLMDRFCDSITPLMRFFGFQALCNDFKLIDNNYLKEKEMFFEDELWQRIRFKHIAEVNKILSKEAEKINRNVKNLQNADTKDLIKMVYEAPEQIALKEEITVFLDLLDKCITKFENENLNFVSLVEQNIVLKKDQNNVKYQKGVDDFFKICNNESINKIDKERLFCLLSVVGYEWQEIEEEKLIKMKIIDKSDVKIDKKGSLLKTLMKEKYKQYGIFETEKKYDISRYKTVLEKMIEDCVNKKNKGWADVTKKAEKEVVSLRKSEFVFQKQKKARRLVCVYVKGGITYEEIRVVNYLNEKLGVDILLGSDEILTHEKFIENLRNKKSQ